MRARTTALLILPLLALATAAAHVPRVGEADTTVQVGDPQRSWAFYDTRPEATPHLYAFDAHTGDPLHAILYTPTSTTDPPTAHLVTPHGTIIPFTTATPPTPFFEPFAPQTLLTQAQLDTHATQTGRYHIEITGPPGPYGLAIGTNERTTLQEHITTPLQLLRVRAWEGTPIWLQLTPYILLPAITLALTRRLDTTIPALYTATALERITHTTRATLDLGTLPGPELAIPLTLATLALLLATLTWRTGPTRHTLIALLALATWTGLILAPALALTLAARHAIQHALHPNSPRPPPPHL